jgi:hypothetical protein
VKASRRLVCALLCLPLLWLAAARAEIKKTVELTSEPPGAQVSLAIGGQNKPIGKTPLKYEAEFHSEMSVLRLHFALEGYRERTLELNAGDSRLAAKLSRGSGSDDETPGGGKFSVQSHMTSKVEMVCRPGTRMVMQACATYVPVYEMDCSNGHFCSQRQTGTRCQSGMVPQYDPCYTRAPVTKYEMKVEPKVTITPNAAASVKKSREK